MPTRREFIQRGAILPALAAFGPTAHLAYAEGADGTRDIRQWAHRTFRILFDDSSDEGAAFGARARRLGAAVLPVRPALGTVWMNVIEPHLKREPTALAGLIDGPSLFCLELLGRDYGMGIVYRVEHATTAAGRVRHSVTGAQPLAGWPSWKDRLDAAGDRWSALAADLALTCPATLRPDARVELLDLAPRREAIDRTLYSWVIAPTGRVRFC